MKTSRRKGVSLIELCIVMALMSMVMLLCVSLISLTVKGVTSADQLASTAMSDAEFAAKIADAVRKSTTSYTIPKNSFIEANLTGGWSYLGLMEGVTVKAGASRTGQEIQNVNALVYLEWIGDTLPAEGAYDENRVTIIDRIAEGDGVFIQYVISHDYTDLSGVTHEYSLVFEPTDASIQSPQMITWSLSATADYGEDTGVTSFDTMMQALNAAQVVYQGDPTNPAVALAFQSNNFPVNSTVTTTEETGGGYEGTIILILECSQSMTGRATDLEAGFNNWPRVNIMKRAVEEFVDKLYETCPDVNLLIVANGGFTWNGVHFDPINAFVDQDHHSGGSLSRDHLPCITIEKLLDVDEEGVTIADNRIWFKRTVGMLTTNGSNNLGDALRYAWYQLHYANERDESLVGDKPILIISLADGGLGEGTVAVGRNTVGGRIPTTDDYFPADYKDHYFCIDTRGNAQMPEDEHYFYEPLYEYPEVMANNGILLGPKFSYSYTDLNGRVHTKTSRDYQDVMMLDYYTAWHYVGTSVQHLIDDFGFLKVNGEEQKRLTMIAASIFMDNGGFSASDVSNYEYYGFRVDDNNLNSMKKFDEYFTQIIEVDIPAAMWVSDGPRT